MDDRKCVLFKRGVNSVSYDEICARYTLPIPFHGLHVQSLNGSSAGTSDRCSFWMGHRDGYLVAGPSVRNTSCLAKGDQNVIQIAMVGQFLRVFGANGKRKNCN